MHRCPPHIPTLLALAGLLLVPALAGAQAQQAASQTAGQAARAFPEAAMRGKIAFTPGKGVVQLNGKPIRTAPGLRIFNARNQLVMLTALKEQTRTVNYVIEPSTGLLHTVWLLTDAEASLQRKGAQERNFEFASEQAAR
jgi:hypothetical protein